MEDGVDSREIIGEFEGECVTAALSNDFERA